jgi:hypothetical protein
MDHQSAAKGGCPKTRKTKRDKTYNGVLEIKENWRKVARC